MWRTVHRAKAGVQVSRHCNCQVTQATLAAHRLCAIGMEPHLPQVQVHTVCKAFYQTLLLSQQDQVIGCSQLKLCQ